MSLASLKALQNPLKHALALSPESKEFFIYHPQPHVGPLQLFFKSTVLLSRTMRVLRGLPFPLGQMKSQMVNQEKLDPMAVANRPEFAEMASSAIKFRTSFAKEYRQALANLNAVELNIITANMISHLATIFMHEPFVTQNKPDVAMAVCT